MSVGQLEHNAKESLEVISGPGARICQQLVVLGFSQRAAVCIPCLLTCCY